MIHRDFAVSPVIGVLLMLTLTLIIAAIVNSYAGGLVETDQKSPSVTLQVRYYNDTGMEIRHISGDPLPTSGVKMVIRPSDTFGRNASQFSSIIQKKYITNFAGNLSWDGDVTSMKPGEVFVVNASNMYLMKDESGNEWVKKFITSENLGNTFFFEVLHKNTLISRNEVLIET